MTTCKSGHVTNLKVKRAFYGCDLNYRWNKAISPKTKPYSNFYFLFVLNEIMKTQNKKTYQKWQDSQSTL